LFCVRTLERRRGFGLARRNLRVPCWRPACGERGLRL